MRFTQPSYPTSHFGNKILARCPNCAEIGVVKTKSIKEGAPVPGLGKACFHCSKCRLVIAENNKWFGSYEGYISRPCGFCGVQISYKIKSSNTYEKEIFKCSSCNQEKEYEITWRKSFKDKTIDPYFGLDLWIQLDIKSNTLWLYNLDHLRYLRDYTQAKLRDDNDRNGRSMITRLPKWIKSAKNRDLIVRKLNSIETELSKKLKKVTF